MKTVLITGGAGFIGSHLCDLLLDTNEHKVICLDNFDSFYDKNLKITNIEKAIGNKNFTFIEGDILNINNIRALKSNVDIIVHLAAKAGVRPSILDPIGYSMVNTIGTQHLLEFARLNKVKQFVYASSSSVYGVSKNVPWKENDADLEPISPYAASKLGGEWSGKVYQSLYDIRFIALRFFTVYGERQRPDLAIHKFFNLILKGEAFPFYGDGSTKRDYTYWKDIVLGIIAAMEYDKTNFEIINLGNNIPVSLMELVEHIEKISGKKAILNKLPEQQGDVPITFADISKAKNLLNFNPTTTLDVGLTNFLLWKKNIEIKN